MPEWQPAHPDFCTPGTFFPEHPHDPHGSTQASVLIINLRSILSGDAWGRSYGPKSGPRAFCHFGVINKKEKFELINSLIKLISFN
jgi:hypothetical protein